MSNFKIVDIEIGDNIRYYANTSALYRLTKDSYYKILYINMKTFKIKVLSDSGYETTIGLERFAIYELLRKKAIKDILNG